MNDQLGHVLGSLSIPLVFLIPVILYSIILIISGYVLMKIYFRMKRKNEGK
ncbi:MAG: hypothetical protein Q4P31_01890 [Andreesenia angusta]|nr:hypothetical protein [Andreesenia angusta]